MITPLTSYGEPEARRVLLYQGEKYQHRNVEIMPYWDYLV